MTKGNKITGKKRSNSSIIAPPLLAEVRKAKSFAAITLSGVVSISTLSGEEISLATHAGRVILRGQGLNLVIFEGNIIEVHGKLEEVSFGYAKN